MAYAFCVRLAALITTFCLATGLNINFGNFGKATKAPLPPPPPPAKPDFNKALGAQPPLGLFDPLGLLKDADEERFNRLRKVEIKHGRISMLAILGHLVTTAGYRLPGGLGFEGSMTQFKDIDTGLAALSGPHALPYPGVIQLIIFIGGIDLAFTNYAEKDVAKRCEDTINDSFKWSTYTRNLKASIELNNGRAAQMGILGLMVHEKLDNNPYILNSLLGVPVAFNAH